MSSVINTHPSMQLAGRIWDTHEHQRRHQRRHYTHCQITILLLIYSHLFLGCLSNVVSYVIQQSHLSHLSLSTAVLSFYNYDHRIAHKETYTPRILIIVVLFIILSYNRPSSRPSLPHQYLAQVDL